MNAACDWVPVRPGLPFLCTLSGISMNIACSIECWTHAVFYYCLCANRSKQTMTHLCFATNEKHSKILYNNCKVTTNQLNILARCKQKNNNKNNGQFTRSPFVFSLSLSLFNLAVRHSLSFFVYHMRRIFFFFFIFFFKLTHCESNSLFSILGNNNIYTLLIQ